MLRLPRRSFFQSCVPAQESIGNPNCGILPNINITNQTPLPTLNADDIFKAGDFPVKVLQTAGQGSYTGNEYVTIPFLGQAFVKVNFSHIGVNTDRQLISGVVVTVFDSSMKQVANVDTVINMADTLINDIKDLVSQTQDFVNAYNRTINQSGGTWYQMESEWARTMRTPNREVTNIQMEIMYGTNKRPVGFRVKANVNGTPKTYNHIN